MKLAQESLAIELDIGSSAGCFNAGSMAQDGGDHAQIATLDDEMNHIPV